jgi:hypothetical protein
VKFLPIYLRRICTDRIRIFRTCIPPSAYFYLKFQDQRLRKNPLPGIRRNHNRSPYMLLMFNYKQNHSTINLMFFNPQEREKPADNIVGGLSVFPVRRPVTLPIAFAQRSLAHLRMPLPAFITCRVHSSLAPRYMPDILAALEEEAFSSGA